MNKFFACCSIIALACFSNSQLHADAVISFGTNEAGVNVIELNADTSGQVVFFRVDGLQADGGANGLEFDVQIGDGGAEIGGADTGPVMTNIDLLSGIFAGKGGTQTNPVVGPLARQSIVDAGSFTDSDGVFASITFDVSGIAIGTEIQFRLDNVAGSFNTSFFDDTTRRTTIVPEGVIRIVGVPEPSSVMLISGFCVVGMTRRRRRA